MSRRVHTFRASFCIVVFINLSARAVKVPERIMGRGITSTPSIASYESYLSRPKTFSGYLANVIIPTRMPSGAGKNKHLARQCDIYNKYDNISIDILLLDNK